MMKVLLEAIIGGAIGFVFGLGINTLCQMIGLTTNGFIVFGLQPILSFGVIGSGVGFIGGLIDRVRKNSRSD